MSRAPRPFADRQQAGRELGAALAGRPAVGRPAVVLGLPRGGVVVAAEVAAVLDAPLDVVVVRKLGLPGQPELAMGAIAALAGALETVRTEDVLSRAGVDAATFAAVRGRELAELRRREAAYRAVRPEVPLAGRTAVLVDDGLATGATMRAAVAVVRHGGPAGVVVAVPAGAPVPCAAIGADVDDLVCLLSPRPFSSVGRSFVDFAPTGDDAVHALLVAAAARGG
jgi:putative phosphoribosyl transferase